MNLTVLVEERWRPVPESRFEASDLGRLRDAATKAIVNPTNCKGYLVVKAWGRQRSVHRMVMEAFVGIDTRIVRHLNDVKTDNRLANLTYGTQAENNRDTVLNGHHRKANQTHCKWGHPFDEANTYRHGNERGCRSCNSRRVLEYKARKKAAA